MLKYLLAHRRVALGIVAALIIGGALQVTNTNPAVSQSQFLNAYESPDDPGLEPDAAVWSKVAGIRVPLSAQAGTYPAGGSVQEVKLQAVHHNDRLFVRVEWVDATQDDATVRVQDFSDAVALEFPAGGKSSVPSICMGQADAAVNIWHWRADSNAGVQDPADFYTSASVDGYPFKSDLFYTARAAGNPFANPEVGAVQSLSARAFGQLAALDVQDVNGFGVHEGDHWAVVFSRDFNTANTGHAAFAASTTTDMAVAVWDGSKGERNGQKAISQFVRLNIGAAPAFESGGTNTTAILIAVGLFIGVTGVGVGFAAYGYREKK
ncbi:MAG: ethylbenzene dehydrogenase-related protein [Dehalococcoidia bacterium]